MPSRKRAWMLWPGVAVLSLLVMTFGGTSIHASDNSILAAVDAPIGVAAALDPVNLSTSRILVTRPYCGNPRQVVSIDSGGHVTLFATLPARPSGCFEDYIAVAQGLGSWRRDVYVTQGPKIWKIPAGGSPSGYQVTLFATIPSSTCPSSRAGITFDTVRTFGRDMLVTCNNGEVWRISVAGVATFVANIGTTVEGPVVAPLSFAPFGGHLLAAAEDAGAVWAVSPSGATALVANGLPSPETVRFVPPIRCSFAGGTFFAAIAGDPLGQGVPFNNITKFPASSFPDALVGTALVPSEFGGGIKRLTSAAWGLPTVSTFHAYVGQHEGAAFCATLQVNIDIMPGTFPNIINPSTRTKIPVAVLSTHSFDAPRVIDRTSLRFGRFGLEHSLAFCTPGGRDVNADGLLDLVCHFHTPLTGIQPYENGGVLTGITLGGNPEFEGRD